MRRDDAVPWCSVLWTLALLMGASTVLADSRQQPPVAPGYPPGYRSDDVKVESARVAGAAEVVGSLIEEIGSATRIQFVGDDGEILRSLEPGELTGRLVAVDDVLGEIRFEGRFSDVVQQVPGHSSRYCAERLSDCEELMTTLREYNQALEEELRQCRAEAGG